MSLRTLATAGTMALAGRMLRNASVQLLSRCRKVPHRARLSLQATVQNDNLVVKSRELVDEFPLVWLRDNCTCEKCFHGPSQSRIINWTEFNVDVNVKTIQTNGNNKIEVCWDDEHKSTYNFDWLKNRSFKRSNQEKYLTETYQPDKILWDKEDFCKIMRTYDYRDIMNNDEYLYNWLKDLAVYGVVLIENSPTELDECKKLSKKVAFIRKTHYGEDFNVKKKPGAKKVGYLTVSLQQHTDLPYYEYVPGVNLLHCIVQTECAGGKNMLTDVHYIMEKLKRENKEVFDILTTTDINWSDIGEDGTTFHKLVRRPMISLDKYGKIQCVRHSILQRDSHFTVDLENVKPWYKALKTFVSLLDAHAAMFKLKPGDILTFDNNRLVHGRQGYEDTDKVSRHLVGHFLDWDEIYSKMRILKKKLGKANFD